MEEEAKQEMALQLEQGEVKLGQSVNLLRGYKPTVFLDADGKAPTVRSEQPALQNERKSLFNDFNVDAKWDEFPNISLHDSVEELVSALQKIQLRPHFLEKAKGSKPAVWPAGAITLGGLRGEKRTEALNMLFEEIGLDLSEPEECSYALVRRNRVVGTAVHPNFESGLFRHLEPTETLTPAMLQSLKKLQKKTHPYEVSKDGAIQYLQLYRRFGTHFVSSLDYGDSLFQVFAYKKKQFEFLRRTFKNNLGALHGPQAQMFSMYTVKHNSEGYGHTSGASKICIASRDPALERSIRDKQWYDDEYMGGDSIFAPYLTASFPIDVNETLKREVVIATELSSLSFFSEHYRAIIWHSIFKGAMYARLANAEGVAPHFENSCPYDLAEIFKHSDIIEGDGLLSTIATPTVSLFKEHIELSSIALQFPEEVKLFSTFSNVLEISAPANQTSSQFQVPGTCNASFIAHVISVVDGAATPPTLSLSKSAFAAIKKSTSCGEFYGGLRLMQCDGEKSLVVMNGLVFEMQQDEIAITDDLRKSPSKDLLYQHLTDLQFALVSVEARLNYLLSSGIGINEIQTESLKLLYRYLLWLGGVGGSSEDNSDLPSSDCSDDKLVALQARALYLAQLAGRSPDKTGLCVPYLNYSVYKDTVQSVREVIKTARSELMYLQDQIQTRKAEERSLKDISTLNQNIAKSGKLLSRYIAAQARYQDDLSQSTEFLIRSKKEEAEQLMHKVHSLSQKLEEQRKTVNSTLLHYKDEVKDWAKQQILKAALDIISNLFEVGFAAIALPEASFFALESLSIMVQRIQKIVKLFDAVTKAYKSFKSFPKNPEKVVNALSDVDPNDLKLPTSEEWSELLVNMEATLAQGPDIGAKSQLNAAFKILVLRGQALLEVQNSIQEKLSELSAFYSNKLVHNVQKKRLSELTEKFGDLPSHDADTIDLIGMSGQLVFFQRQMLMIMASTLTIQDRALQYEYLQPPLAINSFSFTNLLVHILTQAQTINRGLLVQPPPEEQGPVIYEIHGVHPEQLMSFGGYQFCISINKREFSMYNYVRVEKVEAELDGIKSTNSGKYLVHLVFEGDPFVDRGFDGQSLTFHTIPRHYAEAHDCKASSWEPESPVGLKPNVGIGDNPFTEKVSLITPFSTWRISLPPSEINEGITFNDSSKGINILLTFHLLAQLKLAKGLPQFQAQTEAQAAQTRAVVTQHLPPLKPFSGERKITAVSKADVLNPMQGRSVCGGWDVVFSMSEDQINSNLQQQYDNRKDNPKCFRSTGQQSIETPDGTTLIEFNFEFKAPRLQFQKNNNSGAKLTFPLRGGHYKKKVYIKQEKKWYTQNEGDVTEKDHYFFEGNVPLDHLNGEASKRHVVLKLNDGAFSPKNFTPGEGSMAFQYAISHFFMSLKEGYNIYILGTLDTKAFSGLDSLIPTDFLLNIQTCNSGRNVLQLFIATTGNLLKGTHLNVDEPYPTNYQSSLIINSRLFFDSILPHCIGDCGVGLEFAPAVRDGSDKSKAWTVATNSGSISTEFGDIFVSVREDLIGRITMTYVTLTNHKAKLNLSGMKFKRGKWNVQMSMDKSDTTAYLIGTKSCDKGSNCSGISYDQKGTTKTKVTMNAEIVFEVTGAGQNQKLQISSVSSTNAKVKGTIQASGGHCKCGSDKHLQTEFQDALSRATQPYLNALFKRKFDAVSFFALKNILFPERNVIDMKEAHVPGDFIMFGNFTSGDSSATSEVLTKDSV